jgi:hypothetical protein
MCWIYHGGVWCLVFGDEQIINDLWILTRFSGLCEQCGAISNSSYRGVA